MDVVPIGRTDLPRLYRVASATSHRGHDDAVRLTALMLLAGLASASFALAGGTQGPSWHSAADIVAAGLFALATVGGAMLGGGEAQRRWHIGRAAAESIKTLSWKYAMRAAPFEDDASADERFLGRMHEILASMSHVRLAAVIGTDPQAMISHSMSMLRSAPVDVKRMSYERFRLDDQIDWYVTKAEVAEERARQWRLTTVVLGGTGCAGAALRAFGVVEIDALGLAAAAMASIAAWTQLRQYWPNAAAYRVALNELQVIEAESATVPAEDRAWAAFCERAETAISREHTMWLARAR